jgi:hypothetical protein
MTMKEQENLLSDYFRISISSRDPLLTAIGAALFIEQTFDIDISDSEISEENLGSLEAARKLILARAT